jgi:hypothetical protein
MMQHIIDNIWIGDAREKGEFDEMSFDIFTIAAQESPGALAQG